MTQTPEQEMEEIKKIISGIDLSKAAGRQFKFELEKSFAQRHQTSAKNLFDCPSLAPSKFDFKNFPAHGTVISP